MKSLKLVTWMLIAGFTLAMPSAAVATDEQQGKPPQQAVAVQTEPATPDPGMPVYKPPPRGAPGGRVGGGSRGPGDELPMLFVLAPDHTGLAAQEQPSLYWYVSKATTYPIEFTLIDDRVAQPLLETRLSASAQPGVHRVRLADYGVRPAPGVPYRWFVALVVDPERRSKDIIAGGTIERVELPKALHAQLARAGQAKAPHLYAVEGLWYDAVTAISDLIDAAPHDAVFRQQRAALLQQVGLSEIAKHDLRYSRAD